MQYVHKYIKRYIYGMCTHTFIAQSWLQSDGSSIQCVDPTAVSSDWISHYILKQDWTPATTTPTPTHLLHLPDPLSNLDETWWVDVGWPQNCPPGVTWSKVTGVKCWISMSPRPFVQSWWNLIGECRLTQELSLRGHSGKGQGHCGQTSNFNIILALGPILTKLDRWM